MLFDAKRLSAKVAATLAGVMLFAGAAGAAGFYGNQSDIKWKTAGTKHFQFIYPQEYTEHASRLSSYAEAVYDSVVNRYKKDLPGRVNAVLNNALYSNGSAVPSENAVNLWLTNWDFKVRSSHGWLADVITHEFSHLVSIENGSKIVPSLYGIQIGYTDYYNERTTSDFATLIPFTLQPLWFAEGTAQFESARMGFDAWDTHRDMLLRVAVLNDTLLPLEYMHDFADNSLFAELGPYTQGFALVRYIADHYGEDAIPKIWTELSRLYRVTLDAALKKVIGIGEKELYEAWKKEITEKYTAQRDSLGPLVEGKKMTTEAFWQDFPVVAGKHLYGVSNFGGPWFDGAVFKIPLEPDSSAADSTAKKDTAEVVDGVEIGELSLENEEDSDSTIDIGNYAKSGFRAKKPWFDKGIDVYDAPEKGPILAYVTFQNRDKDGHAHFDIAVSDTNKNKLNLTHLVDAVYPAFNPKGNEVAFVRREPFSTRFVLSKVPFTANFDEYTAEDPIDIFVPDAKFKYYNIYSPKYSPDGSHIAFGFFDDVHRGIAVIDADGKNMKVVSTEGYDERDVNWIDDSKIVFASNRNGIFNLIEKNIDTGSERPLTNVVGGAFTPALAGDTLYFTQYDKDGFSLYKMQYTPVAMVNDTTVNIVIDEEKTRANTVTKWGCVNDTLEKSIRDSIATQRFQTDSSCTKFRVMFNNNGTWEPSDSTIWRCEDSTQYIIDSVVYSRIHEDANCIKTLMISKGDSIIWVYDTIRTITQRPAPNEIVLKGSPLPHVEKHIELEEREFAGTEQNYKPIPTVPLFIPILSFNENAPDLTVFGEGQLKTKIGLAAVISDPLKKNTIQLGLLLEIGSGIDYINADGLNPEQEKEFFVAWENHSTPIDFALSYTYANYTSKDTVRYEDVRAHDGDSLGVNHYAVPMQAIMGAAGYSIFKTSDTLQIALGYDWADFNLYEDDFAWTYQKRISAMALFGIYGDEEGEDGTGISGQGDGVTAYYQYSNSDLYRPGTFAESFYVTESGSIKPKYRNFNIHEFGVNLYGSVQSPLTGARLAAGAKVGGIFSWNTDAKEDTLDSYYYSPVLLEGYPYLRSSESYTRAGTKTAMAELHYLFPVYDDWRKGFWIFETRGFYVDAFAQIGAAWTSKWFDMDKFTDHDFWDRSVGLSFRWSNKLFYSIPFDISLTLARALSRIGDENGRSGSWTPSPIDVPLLPDAVSPTRIKFAIGMGFINSWQ